MPWSMASISWLLHPLAVLGATWSIQAAEQGLAKLEATVQGLAQRFEARVQHVEMGSDVKAGWWNGVEQPGKDNIYIYDKYDIYICIYDIYI